MSVSVHTDAHRRLNNIRWTESFLFMPSIYFRLVITAARFCPLRWQHCFKRISSLSELCVQVWDEQQSHLSRGLGRHLAALHKSGRSGGREESGNVTKTSWTSPHIQPPLVEQLLLGQRWYGKLLYKKRLISFSSTQWKLSSRSFCIRKKEIA